LFGGVGGWGGGTIIFFDEVTLRGVDRIRVESTTLKINSKNFGPAGNAVDCKERFSTASVQHPNTYTTPLTTTTSSGSGPTPTTTIFLAALTC